jgi:hypothetical protein
MRDPDFQLKNDSLVLGFDTTRHVLVSLQDPRTGHEFIESLPESPLLWMLSMEKKDGTRFAIPSSAPAVRKVKKSAARNEITLLWSGLEVDGEPNAMEARVIVTLPQDGDRSYWRIEVDNRSRSSLMDLQFPYVSGLSREGQPSAAIPASPGEIWKKRSFTHGAPIRPVIGRSSFSPCWRRTAGCTSDSKIPNALTNIST